MAKTAQERLYDELLDKHGRAVADAFLEAIEDITRAADVERLIAAIAAGRLEEALAALNLDAAAFAPVEEALRAAYLGSGTGYTALINQASPLAAVFRFSGRQPRAEAWLREESAELVTRLFGEQVTMLRSALAEGMARNRHPTTTALEVVGRINRATGRREGGIIGLTAPQEAWARAAREELQSGDPDLMRNYLTRKTRDKRFDRAVKAAIADGRALDAERVGKAMASMNNRLLKLRGDTVGRTESMSAIQAAKREAFAQAMETGDILDDEVERIWRDSSDARVRHAHAIMDGQVRRGMNAPFVAPDGSLLMYPGDPKAPAALRIGCRCDVTYQINWAARLARQEAAGG